MISERFKSMVCVVSLLLIMAPGMATDSSYEPENLTQFQQIWSTGTPAARDADISPNMTWVAVATQSDGGKELKILNLTDGKILFTLPYQAGQNRDAYAVAFSPNGSYVAIGGTGNNITVWNINTRRPAPGGGNIGAASAPYSIKFTPDGKYMIAAGLETGGGNSYGWVRGWNAVTGFSPVGSMSKNYSGRDCYALDIDPAGTRFAVGTAASTGREVFVYAIPSGTQIAEFDMHGSVRSLSFSHDGKYLAMGRGGDTRYGFNDADVLVWDAKTNYSGQGNPPIRSRYDGFPNNMWVRGVAWSYDDTQIIAGGDQNNLHIFNPDNGNQISVINSEWLWSLTVSNNDLYMVTTHGSSVKGWGDVSLPEVSGFELYTIERKGLPFFPNYIKGERVIFNITFSKPMNTAGIPVATFGKAAPYKQFALKPLGWINSFTWQAEYNFTGFTGPEGVFNVMISNASDTNGRKMQADYNHTFFLDMKEPSLSVTQPAYWQRNISCMIPFTAIDPDPQNSSELAVILPIFRFNNDLNLSWGNYQQGTVKPLNGTQVTSEVQFDFPSGEGYYEISFLLMDRSTNYRPIQQTDVYLGYDNTTPTLSISVEPSGSFWRNRPLNVTYTVDDNVNISGLVRTIAFSPDNSSWTYGEYTVNASGKSFSINFGYDVPGYYNLSGRCRDESGLLCAPVPEIFLGFDGIKPESKISPLPKYSTVRDITIPFTASDNLSGISRVELYVNDGSGWVKSTEVSYNMSEFMFAAPSDGVYAFYSIAIDNASNIEDPPPGNDTWIIVDTQAPAFTLQNPGNGATNVPITTDVRVLVDPEVDRKTVVFSLTSPAGPVIGDLTWVGNTLVFTPSASLELNTKYEISISGSDYAGNQGSGKWSFTTMKEIDITPPRVTGTSPPNGGIVPSLSVIKITFNEDMLSSVEESVTLSSGNIDRVTWYPSNRTLVVSVSGISLDTEYHVTVNASKAKDISGNPLDGNSDGKGGDDYTFSFYVTTQSPATLTVIVFDNSNNPLLGANVTLYLGGQEVRKDVTGPDGKVVFSGLMPGSYTITVECQGYRKETKNVVLSFGDKKDIQFTLSKEGEIVSGADWLVWLILLIIVIVVIFVLLVLLRKKDMKKCSNCGEMIPKKADLCPKCGYDFIRKTTLELTFQKEVKPRKRRLRERPEPKEPKEKPEEEKPSEEKGGPKEPEGEKRSDVSEPSPPAPPAAPGTKKDIERSEEESGKATQQGSESAPEGTEKPGEEKVATEPESKEKSEVRKRALEKIKKRREQAQR